MNDVNPQLKSNFAWKKPEGTVGQFMGSGKSQRDQVIVAQRLNRLV